MYTQDMLESIKKVEATREARIQAVLAGNHPRRMTAEEKEQVLLENHPDHIADQFTELVIGPNKGEKVPLELADLLQANPRINPADVDLGRIDYDVDVLIIGGGGAGYGSVGGGTGGTVAADDDGAVSREEFCADPRIR